MRVSRVLPESKPADIASRLHPFSCFHLRYIYNNEKACKGEEGRRCSRNFEEYHVVLYKAFRLPRESPEKSRLFFKASAGDTTVSKNEPLECFVPRRIPKERQR